MEGVDLGFVVGEEVDVVVVVDVGGMVVDWCLYLEFWIEFVVGYGVGVFEDYFVVEGGYYCVVEGLGMGKVVGVDG